MKPILVTLLMLSSLAARAEPALPLVPGVEELTRARHDETVGRNLIVAAAVMQGVGLSLSGISDTGVFGNREGFIAVNGVTVILGFTSLMLIPAGIVYWARGARHERHALRGPF